MTEPKHSAGCDVAATPEAAAQIHADIEACDRALDALLSAIINNPPPASQEPIRSTPIRWQDPKAIPPRGSVNLPLLIRDPIGTACRAEIRRIGVELFRLTGSTGAMRKVAERVAERDPSKEGRRASIIDSAWNGIGEGNNRWWS
jgi:hypothetical protein